MKTPRANQVPFLNLTNLMKKTPPRSEKIVDGIHRGFRFVPNPAVMVFTALFALTQVAGAANLLVNPLFDLTPAKTGWTTFGNTPQVSTNATYYNAGECPPDSPAENVSAYPPGNSNVANVYGNFNAQVNYSGWDQTFAAAPGSTWSAGGWTYASHEDLAGGQNSFYYQVNFKDSGGNTIASFASLIVTNLTCGGGGSIPLDTWVFLPCTNQMQVVGGFANGTVIATYPSGVFTAPPNTAQVTFTALFVNTGYGGGSIYFDDVDLDQVSGFTPPTMSALSPNLRCDLHSKRDHERSRHGQDFQPGRNHHRHQHLWTWLAPVVRDRPGNILGQHQLHSADEHNIQFRIRPGHGRKQC
jgi:hypothetical protein